MLEQFVVYITNKKTHQEEVFEATRAEYLAKMHALNGGETPAVHPINGWPVYKIKNVDVDIDIA